MLTNIIKAVTGFACEATDDTGDCVAVFPPRPFADEPEVFLFIQKTGEEILISDDAEVLMHHGNCEEAVNEIATIVRASGLQFTNGAIELYCSLGELGPAVRKYLLVMSTLAKRERDFNRMSAQAWHRKQALTVK